MHVGDREMTATLDPRKWQQSSFYREALENMVTYNNQLMKERRARLPYVDAQTGIAQSDCHLWRSRMERRRGRLPGHVYSYPPRRWRRESQPLEPRPRKEGQVESVGRGISPATGLIQTMEGGVVTKRSSRIAGMSRKETEGVTIPGIVRVPLESPVSSEMNEEEESPDADLDYLDEYDSEEEKKQRRKKKVAKTRTTTSHRSSREQDRDKPFLCSVCNRRYKTAASLKAHHTQYHTRETLQQLTAAAVSPPEEKVPVILPPPPNLQGKQVAKPNPYCDFCLGDNICNKKTSKVEKMVSCADCGRSAHPSCMQFSPQLAAMVLTYRWQCIECKSCHFCGTSENDDQLLFCDDCDRGYHMYCLKPPIKEPPEGSWSCGMCLRPASSVNAIAKSSL